MSYKTWNNYGIGVDVTKLETTPEKIAELLKLAPKYNEHMQEWLKENEIDNPTVDDYEEFEQDTCLGIADIMKNVIEEAENLYLTSCDDYDGNRFLIYQASYPWYMNDVELNLTEERLESIFKKYFKILTDDEIVVEEQDVENGG